MAEDFSLRKVIAGPSKDSAHFRGLMENPVLNISGRTIRSVGAGIASINFPKCPRFFKESSQEISDCIRVTCRSAISKIEKLKE
jgi:hypothetical protein